MSSPTPPGQPPQPPYGQPPQQQPPYQPQPPYQQQPPYPQQPPYQPQGQPPFQQPPYQQYPPQMQPGGPKQGGGALKWILIGVGFLVLCIVLFIGVSTYFVYRTVKNAGFDPQLMQRNPGLALARMATAFNPDAELVSTDERAGTVTIREKSTGKTITLKFDPDKKSMVVVDEDGKQAEIKVSGDNNSGAVEINGPDGTVKFGTAAGSSTPAWVPVYPGSSPQGTFSAQTPEGTSNTYSFKTRDNAGQVLAYYENQLKGTGFSISTTIKSNEGGMLAGESPDKKHTLMITVGSSSEGAEVGITAIEKK